MVAEEKTDLRIKKTQKALVSAMFLLLRTQPFSKITVNDICTEAMVSRSAFYANFQDKYALLQYGMGTLRESLFCSTGNCAFKEKLRHLLDLIQKDEKVFRNLVMTDVDRELIEMLRLSFQEDFTIMMEQKAWEIPLSKAGIPLAAVYYAAAFTSAIIYWIEKNMAYSVDELTEVLLLLLENGVISVDAEAQYQARGRAGEQWDRC